MILLVSKFLTTKLITGSRLKEKSDKNLQTHIIHKDLSGIMIGFIDILLHNKALILC